MLMFAVWADRDMRQCETNCAYDIPNAQTRALIAWGVVRKVPSSTLSANGRQIQRNAVEAFRRWYLAAGAYENGSYSSYVAHSKEAIRQAAAATKRLNKSAWFNLLMVTSGCPSWQLAVRVVGMAPCE